MELRLKIGERENQFVWYETAKEASILNMLPKKETDMMEFTRWMIPAICVERLLAVNQLVACKISKSRILLCFFLGFHFGNIRRYLKVNKTLNGEELINI